MRKHKLLPAIMLAVIVSICFLPKRKTYAWPISIPYQIVVDTQNANSIIISTNNFPGANSSISNNVVNEQWCISHLIVSSTAAASTVTIAWATSTALSPMTTDYYAITHGSGIPYDVMWGIQSPYCAPVGQSVVKINSSVSGSSITVEGFLFKGWTP
jgi:hypothetical protein